jgi:hypothetical protein
LRWSSFETWNKLMTPSFLWKYPIFHIKGTRNFGCIPRSNRRQLMFCVAGEIFVFLSGCLIPWMLLLVGIVKGQNFGIFPNVTLIILILLSLYGCQFSFILFNNRELFVSSMRHIVQLENDLSNGK